MVALSAAGSLGLARAGSSKPSVDRWQSVLIEDKRIFALGQGRIRVPNTTACVLLRICLRVGQVVSSQGSERRLRHRAK
jgi:hypothetical protein